MNAINDFFISYLVPEITMFKEQKHDTQNWFTTNNKNIQNYDVIKFARLSLSYKINYNSASTDSNRLKLCKQKVAKEIQLIVVEFWSSRQHSRFQALAFK